MVLRLRLAGSLLVGWRQLQKWAGWFALQLEAKLLHVAAAVQVVR